MYSSWWVANLTQNPLIRSVWVVTHSDRLFLLLQQLFFLLKKKKGSYKNIWSDVKVLQMRSDWAELHFWCANLIRVHWASVWRLPLWFGPACSGLPFNLRTPRLQTQAQTSNTECSRTTGNFSSCMCISSSLPFTGVKQATQGRHWGQWVDAHGLFMASS